MDAATGEEMRNHRNETEPMARADMVTLESALRHNWAIPDARLQRQLRRVQAVLDDRCSNDRVRWRARRFLELPQLSR